jgi:hypothetical protein
MQVKFDVRQIQESAFLQGFKQFGFTGALNSLSVGIKQRYQAKLF